VTAGNFAQAYSNRFRQMAQMRGGKYTTDNARQDNLKSETLKGLVDQELIAQQAEELGIQVSDVEVADSIAKNPQFQQDGKFDFDYYKRLVENGYGMSINRFEDAWRRDLLRAKVVQAAIAGANLSDDELKAAYQSQHESAAISYVRFNAFMFRDKASATDAEALEGFSLCSRLEGILPALETAHAVVEGMKQAAKRPREDVVVICFSGRGDKDSFQVARLLGPEIEE